MIKSFIDNKRTTGCPVLIILVFSLMGFHLPAQEYTLRLKVKNLQAVTKTPDSIYVAGNFNGWNPGKEEFRLTKTDDVFSIAIPGLKEDSYEFKFTRGDWDKGEVNHDGSRAGNRLVKLIS